MAAPGAEQRCFPLPRLCLSKLLGAPPPRSRWGWVSNSRRSAAGGAPEAARALPGQPPVPVSPCCSHEPYAPPPRCAPHCPRAARSRPSLPAPSCRRRPWRAPSGSGAMAAGGGGRCSARGGARRAACPAAAAGCTQRVSAGGSGGRLRALGGERRTRTARGGGEGAGTVLSGSVLSRRRRQSVRAVPDG